MVVGWILVSHDGNGGLRSCDHRHGVSVKNGVKRGSEAECYLNASLMYSFRYHTKKEKVKTYQRLLSLIRNCYIGGQVRLGNVCYARSSLR